MADLELVQAAIRSIPDFPKPGILFRDISPVLSDGRLFQESVGLFVEELSGKGIQKIVGIDARGFLFGAAVACKMGVGFVPIRKRGKLPYKTISKAYDLEYGNAELEMHVDALVPGEKVALVDDLLATGGTAGAAVALMRELGADIVEALFLIELVELSGCIQLGDIPTKTFIQY